MFFVKAAAVNKTATLHKNINASEQGSYRAAKRAADDGEKAGFVFGYYG
jgi:hypothetical protein